MSSYVSYHKTDAFFDVAYEERERTTTITMKSTDKQD